MEAPVLMKLTATDAAAELVTVASTANVSMEAFSSHGLRFRSIATFK